MSLIKPNIADNCCHISQVCVICLSKLWRNVPKGPDTYWWLSIQVCSQDIWTSLPPRLAWGKKSNPALDTIIRSGEREIASLWSHSWDKTGVCLIISRRHSCPVLFCSCHNKIPSALLYWSKAFRLPFKEKWSTCILVLRQVRVFGAGVVGPHKAMWSDTTGRSSHLRQLC